MEDNLIVGKMKEVHNLFAGGRQLQFVNKRRYPFLANGRGPPFLMEDTVSY
jgi:hypothetical protein